MRSTPRSPRTPHALLTLAAAAALVLAPSAALAGERPSDDAHPSGRERSEEPGRSGTRGAAASDPDDAGRDPDDAGRGPDRTDDDVDRADGDTHVQPSARARAGEDAAPRPTRDDSAAGRQTQVGSATTTATFACTSVDVTSTRDLSNVVLVFADGDVQRFEGLSGHAGTFAGTDDHAGERIVRIYVKSGDNASGEGPGYGARHDSDAACAAASTAGVATAQAATAPLAGSATVTHAAVPGDVTAAGTTGPTVGPAVVTAVGGGVLGGRLDRPALAAADGEVGVAAAGSSVRPAAAPSLLGTDLPRTGTGAGAYALAAILALGGGVLAVRRNRTA